MQRSLDLYLQYSNLVTHLRFWIPGTMKQPKSFWKPYPDDGLTPILSGRSGNLCGLPATPGVDWWRFLWSARCQVQYVQQGVQLSPHPIHLMHTPHIQQGVQLSSYQIHLMYTPHTLQGVQLSSYPIHLMDTPHTQPGVHATVPPPHLSYTYTPQTAGCATVLLPHPSIIKISHQRTLFKIEN